jgi:hypothetical protein
MKKLIALAASALVSCAASAAVVLDFNAIPRGLSVDNYYDGGPYGVNGPNGPDLGIRFSGATVGGTTAEFGSYIGQRFGDSSFTVTFDPSIARVAGQSYSAVSFLFNTFNEQPYIETVFNGNYDRQAFQGNFVPCPSREACAAQGISYRPDFFGTATYRFDPNITSLTFVGVSIDNLSFGVESANTGFTIARTEIPEPASLALVGLGLAGLVASRRRSSKN